MMKWFSHLILGLIIMLVMTGMFSGCNHQKPDGTGSLTPQEGIADTLAVDADQQKKQPDEDREV